MRVMIWEHGGVACIRVMGAGQQALSLYEEGNVLFTEEMNAAVRGATGQGDWE